MKQQSTEMRINELLAQLVIEVRGSTALGLTDINKYCEDCFVPVLKHALGLPGLRNLNQTAKRNFPAIDLADDESETAIQVTATPDKSKVMDTLKKFAAHGQHTNYRRLLIYVITEKQERYSETGVLEALDGRLDFDINRDVLDYRDILQALRGKPLETLDAVQRALEKQVSYVGVSHPVPSENTTGSGCELAVSFKKAPPSTSDVHWYWLTASCTNNAAQKQDGYALELFFPFDVPVESVENQDEPPEEIEGLRYRKVTINSKETIYRTRTIQMVDERRHGVKYQMNDDLFWRAKEWQFRWRFYVGDLSVLEGGKPWNEMHNF
jgi:hypothetical protein